MNPLAEQAAPQQPPGAAQANPLAQLAAPLPGLPPPPPAPTAAQTTAAVRRFGAVMDAMRDVMNTKDFGRVNCRPAILDAASRLMASRLLSLPETMSAIGPISDDPLAQKQQVASIFNSAKQAENNVLAHHGMAVATGRVPRGGEKYQAADHDRHVSDLLNHYPKRG